MKRLLLIIPLAAVLLTLLLWSQHRVGRLVVSGFVESHQIRVGSRVGGRVRAVPVVEGQAVRVGDVLVELEPYDLQERLAQSRATLAAQVENLKKLQAGARREEIAQARAARERAQAALDELVAGPRALEIKAQEARVAQAQAELTKARQDYERLQRLAKQGTAAEDEMTAVTRGLAVAEASELVATRQLDLLREGTRPEEIAQGRAQLAQAQAALDLLEAGTRAEDIAQAQATVDAARAAVDVIERQVAELRVVAPVDSTVEAVDLRPGDLIAANAPVVSLADPAELWVRAYVPENMLDVQLGQKLAVTVDAFAGREFGGHVIYISRNAEFTPNNVQTPEERSKQVFRIKVLLDEGRDVLRAGMVADVHLQPASGK